jgi:hypothetical protein
MEILRSNGFKNVRIDRKNRGVDVASASLEKGKSLWDHITGEAGKRILIHVFGFAANLLDLPLDKMDLYMEIFLQIFNEDRRIIGYNVNLVHSSELDLSTNTTAIWDWQIDNNSSLKNLETKLAFMYSKLTILQHVGILTSEDDYFNLVSSASEVMQHLFEIQPERYPYPIARESRIYISGPIRGKENFNKEAFCRAEKYLKDRAYIPINPLRVNHMINQDNEIITTEEPRNLIPISYYLRNDMAHLITCDFIYLLEGHENSEGATFEKMIAEKLNIPVYL